MKIIYINKYSSLNIFFFIKFRIKIKALKYKNIQFTLDLLLHKKNQYMLTLTIRNSFFRTKKQQ